MKERNHTICFGMGEEVVLDSIYVDVDNDGILKLRSQLFAHIFEAFIEGFGNLIVNPKAANLVNILVAVWMQCQLFWRTP